ncbi:hypothetical protein BJ508DRAFT_313608 [Ascobolus immersus RN42]|uniref:BTB domain-containing protein n=1 Tax=Ascobolus immersus RN42 TaxID=1160509 RepID=A0A3N4HI46_ASCIM|nr:hypothetical protein BJ508DRAFT_313608 [Ascobolus immersus RN42]
MPHTINEVIPPALPSVLCSSPTITICLRQPGASEDGLDPHATRQASVPPPVQTSKKSTIAKKNPTKKVPGSRNKSGNDAGTTSDPPSAGNTNTTSSTMPTFQVHVAALVSQSLYFKSLMSFDAGMEKATNKVVFECPTDCRAELNRFAFSCFVDFLYNGTFDIENYTYHEGSFISIPGMESASGVKTTGDRLVFIGILYVLGEKLLARQFQKMLLQKMYDTMLQFQTKDFARRSTGGDTEEDRLPGTVLWSHVGSLVDIVFRGTPSRSFSHDEPSSSEELEKEFPILDLKARKLWLGGENMRNLVAAFLSFGWSLSNGMARKCDVDSKHEIIRSTPEVQEWLLAYLLIPKPGDRRLDRLPKSDFGLQDESG